MLINLPINNLFSSSLVHIITSSFSTTFSISNKEKMKVKLQKKIFYFLFIINYWPRFLTTYVDHRLQQKIVIKISMHDEKCRSKALKVVVSIPGKLINLKMQRFMKNIYISKIFTLNNCILFINYYFSGNLGVESAAVAGEEKDQVEVIGNGIDSVKLTRRLRKKMGHAELLSVGAADSEQPSPPAVVEEEPPAPVCMGVVATPYYGFPHYHHYEVTEPTCYNPCAIL